MKRPISTSEELRPTKRRRHSFKREDETEKSFVEKEYAFVNATMESIGCESLRRSLSPSSSGLSFAEDKASLNTDTRLAFEPNSGTSTPLNIYGDFPIDPLLYTKDPPPKPEIEETDRNDSVMASEEIGRAHV